MYKHLRKLGKFIFAMFMALALMSNLASPVLATEANTVTESSFWGDLKNAGNQLWDKTKEKAPEVWQDVKEGASDAADSVREHAPEVWQNVKDGAAQAADTAREKAPEVIQGAKDTLHEAQDRISDWNASQQDQFWDWVDGQTGGKSSSDTLSQNIPGTNVINDESPFGEIDENIQETPAPPAAIDMTPYVDTTPGAAIENPVKDTPVTAPAEDPETATLPDGEYVVVDGQLYQKPAEDSQSSVDDSQQAAPDSQQDGFVQFLLIVVICVALVITVVMYAIFKPRKR